MKKMDIYNSLPIWLQNAAVSLEGRRIQCTRYGECFQIHSSEAFKRNRWSYEERIKYRDAKLREIVTYAYNKVPYYQRCFKEMGVDPNCIKGLNDIGKLPIIDKRVVRENLNDFISSDYTSRTDNVVHLHTSGTTGSGLNLITTIDADAESWAIGWREHNNIGIKRGTVCAYFAGKAIVPAKQITPPFYRINKAGNQIMFSSFHINEETVKYYVDAFNRMQPEWIHGYPSVIGLLASLINRGRYKIDYRIRTITLSSENVTEHQRREIIKAFGVNPFQTYGQTEGVAYFRDYAPGEIYVVEDYSAVEFVRMEDGTSHIVGTSFWNKAMPLIRYDTHDIASCVETRNGRKVLDLDGRLEDYVLLKDGSRIGRLDHIFKDACHVIEAQIIQETREYVKICIVKDDNYTDVDERKIRELAEERFGNRIKYDLAYVQNIPRTKNGKLRFVVCNCE